MRCVLLVPALAGLILAACAGDPPKPLPGERPSPRGPSAGEAFVRYDFNKDGQVTAAELAAGLRAEFAAADTNHDGVLDLDEMRVVNEHRMAADGTSATPLIDWNQDGHVDFQEFAAAPRSLFNQLDRNNDGVLDQDEIHPRRRPEHAPRAPIQPFGATPG